MALDLPEPVPFMIDLGDYFILDPRYKEGELDHARIDRMLAMSPDERLRWNQCWCKFIEEAAKRGDDIGELVYGQPCPYESS
jgi:hypothetical protein